MIEVSKDQLKRSIEESNNRKQQLGKIIKPFLSDTLSQKQKIELCQVGKFIMLLDQPTEIISHRDSPDFIISYNGENIGLEHERIFKSDKVKSVESITKLFSDSAIIFKTLYPEHKLLANCWLNTQHLSFKNSEKAKLQKEIANYVFSVFTNSNSFAKPYYIDQVDVMKHTDVSINYNSGVNILSDIDSTVLEKSILKKTALLDKYKKHTKINKQWLLLVIGSKRPDSYEFGNKQFKIDINSNFDRVYLLEDFVSTLWQIS
jgi:hypothetical protein